jgi:serine/threonine-protein kinase RsbW
MVTMNKELVIKSKLENMSLVENFIDEVSVCLSIVSDLYGNLLISTIEAVTNAIVHGNESNPDKLVRINVEGKEHSINVTVADEGKGFNVNVIPDPTKPDYIEKPNGRGIFLMKNLADKVKFDKNGSVVTLTFNI